MKKARLNEIRSSNLNNLKNLSYVKAAREFPKELLRLLYNMFEDRGIEVDPTDKMDTIRRFTEDLESSFSKVNWFLDGRNSRTVEISDNISITIEYKEASVSFTTQSIFVSGIEMKFNVEDKVDKIFNNVVNFVVESKEKLGDVYSGNMSKDGLRNIRKELRDKYSTSPDPKFIKSIRAISEKHGFKFRGSGSRDLSYEIMYNEVSDVIKNIDDKLVSYINVVKMRKNIFPVIIRKAENSNYLIKDYRELSDYVLIEFTDKAPNTKIAGQKMTQIERHNKIKDLMFENDYGKEVIIKLFKTKEE